MKFKRLRGFALGMTALALSCSDSSVFSEIPSGEQRLDGVEEAGIGVQEATDYPEILAFEGRRGTDTFVTGGMGVVVSKRCAVFAGHVVDSFKADEQLANGAPVIR